MLKCGAAVALSLFAVTTSSVRAQCQYDVTLIQGPEHPFWGLPDTNAMSITANGRVAGHYRYLENHAFFWSPEQGVFTLQPFPAGTWESEAWDLNDTGMIVGWFQTNRGLFGYVYSQQGLTIVEPPGGCCAQPNSVNDAGIVAGTTTTETPYFRAFTWENGEMTLIEPTFGPRSNALDISETGHVVGWMGTSHSIDAHPFLWDGGKMIDLGILPEALSGIAKAVNERGQVVGGSWFAADGGGFHIHPTLWSNGRIIDLGNFPGLERGNALDINNVGQIIGSCYSYEDPLALGKAFLWQHGTMTELNELIDPTEGLWLYQALAINDSGQIITWPSFPATEAVLLTPSGSPVGDLDIDCTVGVTDFLMLLQSWGPCPEPCPPSCVADLDGDCNVGVTDFLILLINWT